MFAGIRLGFAVGSAEAITNVNKVMVHQIYSPATVSQYMLIEPVRSRARWLPSVQSHYKKLRDLFVENLEIDFPSPEGTYFIFFPADKYLNGRNYEGLIEELLDNLPKYRRNAEYARRAWFPHNNPRAALEFILGHLPSSAFPAGDSDASPAPLPGA